MQEDQIYQLQDELYDKCARLDRTAFESVLLNLVDNALRYVPRGGHVALTLAAGAHTLALRVADDGPGIPTAEREAAFERFWRGAAGSNVAGAGLGLAICRAIVNAHGGAISAAPRAGGGARFTITLPLAEPSGAQVA